MNPQTQPRDSIMLELMKQLDALWDKAYDKCNRFYEEYERGYEELENEPFDCELSSARIRRIEGGDRVAIDYSAAHIYDACVSYRCGPYDEEEVDVERAYIRCKEACLEDAENYAKRVLSEYRRAVERWAKRRGVAYTEELKRDELNFTLIVRLHPAAVGP